MIRRLAYGAIGAVVLGTSGLLYTYEHSEPSAEDLLIEKASVELESRAKINRNLRERVDTLEERLADVGEDLEKQRDGAKKLRKERDELTEQNKTLEEGLERFDAKYAAVERDLVYLRRHIIYSEGENAHLHKENKEIKQEYMKLLAGYEDLKEKYSFLTDWVDSTKEHQRTQIYPVYERAIEMINEDVIAPLVREEERQKEAYHTLAFDHKKGAAGKEALAYIEQLGKEIRAWQRKREYFEEAKKYIAVPGDPETAPTPSTKE